MSTRTKQKCYRRTRDPILTFVSGSVTLGLKGMDKSAPSDAIRVACGEIQNHDADDDLND